jgi:hypothetical protein
VRNEECDTVWTAVPLPNMKKLNDCFKVEDAAAQEMLIRKIAKK